MGPQKRHKVEKVPKAKGFKQDEVHHRYFIFYRPTGERTRIKTKTSHGPGSTDIDRSLLGLMQKQLHLNARQFGDLLGCSLDHAGYDEILAEAGLVA
jgi:hypothetical protein